MIIFITHESKMIEDVLWMMMIEIRISLEQGQPLLSQQMNIEHYNLINNRGQTLRRIENLIYPPIQRQKKKVSAKI